MAKASIPPGSQQVTTVGVDLLVEEARSRHEEIANIIKEMRSDCWTGLVITAAWPWILLNYDKFKGLKWMAVLPLIACGFYYIMFWYKAYTVGRVAKYLRGYIEPHYPRGTDGVKVIGWETWLRKRPLPTCYLDNIITALFWTGLIFVNFGVYKALLTSRPDLFP
jgi:hypothetical protein